MRATIAPRPLELLLDELELEELELDELELEELELLDELELLLEELLDELELLDEVVLPPHAAIHSVNKTGISRIKFRLEHVLMESALAIHMDKRMRKEESNPLNE